MKQMKKKNILYLDRYYFIDKENCTEMMLRFANDFYIFFLLLFISQEAAGTLFHMCMKFKNI